jgi:hypothetical protein
MSCILIIEKNIQEKGMDFSFKFYFEYVYSYLFFIF